MLAECELTASAPCRADRPRLSRSHTLPLRDHHSRLSLPVQGYIRLARYGSTPAGEPCGTDTTPGDGDGCKGGPAAIQVCGACGVLSDSSYPTGASLVQ